MIPFYFFRKKSVSPTASLYHSGLLENIDHWGKIDRLAVLDEIRHYSKMYALDWGLTIGLFACAMTGLWLLLHVLTGYPYNVDYLGIITDLVLVMLGSLVGSVHIIEQYKNALEFIEDSDV